MSRSISPLRYPGGKAKLYSLFREILKDNELLQRRYVEPYSGGCGLGLALLLNGIMSRLHINDVDRSIWAFWYSILHHTDQFVDRIGSCPVTLDEWHRQRAVQKLKHDAPVFELGFSTFFLNRTNRSGVIHSGGVIGGLDQSGPYKIDCRFNRKDLAHRITRIAKYGNRISLTCCDAEELLRGDDVENSVIYIDPPYYEKGSTLYMNAYAREDHLSLAATLRDLASPWVLTYDNVLGIRELYADHRYFDLQISYSVQNKRLGAELLILPGLLSLPRGLKRLN